MSDEFVNYSTLPTVRPWYEPHSSEPKVEVTEGDVSRSYLRQWYRLTVGEQHMSLRPTGLEHNELWPEPVAPSTVLSSLVGRYLLTWWSVPGQVCSASSRAQQEAVLSDLLSQKDWQLEAFAVFADDSKWVEPGVLVDGPLDEVAEVASALGQPVVARLEENGITLIRLGDGSAKGAVESEEFVPLEARVTSGAPCPMSRGPETSFPVKRQGGPGTSRGHAVAAMWAEYSRVAHRLVECSVHPVSGFGEYERGRALPLYEIAYPTRYSPMAFLKDQPTS